MTPLSLASLLLLLLPLIQAADSEQPATTEMPCQCQIVFFEADKEEANFSSPGYPERHCAGVDCVWEILPRKDYFIELEYFNVTLPLVDEFTVEEVIELPEESVFVPRARETGSTSSKGILRSTLNSGFRVRFNTSHEKAETRLFSASFKRLHKDASRACPDVILQVTRIERELPSLDDFPLASSPCAFLLNSSLDHSVNVTIAFKENTEVTVSGKAKKFGEENLHTTVPDEETVSVVSRTPSAIVHVSRSDADVPANYSIRFKAVPCRCCCFVDSVELRLGMSKTLLSPGFGTHNYCEHLHCSTKVTTMTTKRESFLSAVLIHLHELDLADSHDLLRVLLPPNQAELYKLTGTMKEQEFLVASDRFFLDFTTDEGLEAKGFNVSLQSVEIPRECGCPDSPVQTLLHEEERGEIALSLPEYCGRVACRWRVVSPEARRERFTMNIDYLFNAPNENIGFPEYYNWPAYLGLNPVKSSAVLDVSAVRALEIHYERPAGVGKASFFNISYQFLQGCECGEENLEAKVEGEGELKSPGYPGRYCSALFCSYTITAPENHTVVLYVHMLDLEEFQDSLAVYDGSDASTTLLETLTGEAKDRVVKSTDNSLTLKLSTDTFTTAAGYLISFNAVPMEGNRKSSPILETSLAVGIIALCLLVLFGILLYRCCLRRAKDKKPNQQETVEREKLNSQKA